MSADYPDAKNVRMRNAQPGPVAHAHRDAQPHAQPDAQRTDNMAIAWLGLLGALAGSIAINCARAWLHGYPGVAHTAVSLLPPLAFFWGVEALARYRHIHPWGMGLSVGAIVLAAFGTSYWMIFTYMEALGWPFLAAMVSPLLLDGVMAGSTIILTSTRKRARTVPPASLPRRAQRPAAANEATVTRPPARPERAPAAPPPPSGGATADLPEIRTLVRKRYLEGDPIGEIAASAGVSPRTVNGWTRDLRDQRNVIRRPGAIAVDAPPGATAPGDAHLPKENSPGEDQTDSVVAPD